MIESLPSCVPAPESLAHRPSGRSLVEEIGEPHEIARTERLEE